MADLFDNFGDASEIVRAQTEIFYVGEQIIAEQILVFSEISEGQFIVVVLEVVAVLLVTEASASVVLRVDILELIDEWFWRQRIDIHKCCNDASEVVVVFIFNIVVVMVFNVLVELSWFVRSLGELFPFLVLCKTIIPKRKTDKVAVVFVLFERVVVSPIIQGLELRWISHNLITFGFNNFVNAFPILSLFYPFSGCNKVSQFRALGSTRQKFLEFLIILIILVSILSIIVINTFSVSEFLIVVKRIRPISWSWRVNSDH